MRAFTVVTAVVGGAALAATEVADLPPAVLWAAFVVLGVTTALLGLACAGSAPWWLRGVAVLGATGLAAAVWVSVEAEFGTSPLRVVAGVVTVAASLSVGVTLVVRRVRRRRAAARVDVRVPSPRQAEQRPARLRAGARRRGAHSR